MVRATKDQISEFKKSFLWKDMKRELGAWKRGFEKGMMTVIHNCVNGELDGMTALAHLGSIHGRCMAIDFMLELPNVFLEEKKMEEEDKENDS